MSVQVPSLDTAGWVVGAAQKADRLLSYFLISDHSQSNTFRGNIASLPKLIQDNPRDFIKLKNDIKLALDKLFGGYFDSAVFQVSIEDTKSDTGNATSKVNIKIIGEVTDEGVVHSLGKLVYMVNNKLSKIVDIRYA